MGSDSIDQVKKDAQDQSYIANQWGQTEPDQWGSDSIDQVKKDVQDQSYIERLEKNGRSNFTGCSFFCSFS